MKDKKIYWLWNDFGHYYDVPKAGYDRAKAMCDKLNQRKGGRWEIHTKEQYDEWWNRKGKFLEQLKLS